MSFRRNGLLHRLLMIMFAIGAFEAAAYGQFSVTITGPGYNSAPSPTAQFTVRAEVSGILSNQISKVVFYRNDVPYKTFPTAPADLIQDQLGQDTYTYRARVYNLAGVWMESPYYELTVHTPRVFKMGEAIPAPSPSPAPSPAPTPYQTTGPDRDHDHTAEIQAAVTYLAQQGGGTLFFPCVVPDFPSPPYPPNLSQGFAVYNIKATIDIPSNVTLQGEGAEEPGRCRIYWNDVTWNPYPVPCAANPIRNNPMNNRPMFRIIGNSFGIRFKDLWLYSRTTGPNCPYPRVDFGQIEAEKITAIEMNTTGGTGNIRDAIVENVAITNFKYGIKAISDNGPLDTNEISDIKIRGYRPVGNHRQLYINAKHAYNWDVQNMNITYMMQTQGAIEIVNAGKPATPVTENTKLKFLQVNCNASRTAPPDFCVQVEKHGGLYFRQLHHEGTNQAIIVKDISGSATTATTNPDPIVFESSVGTGLFYDPSMKLYLIGNAVFAAPEIADPRLDTGRLRFIGSGVNATVFDCGDTHWDVTNTNPDQNQTDPPPPITWEDLGMYFSHAERNRPSFFAVDSAGKKFNMPHTICPLGINEVGGEYFDSGVMPTELRTYSHQLSEKTCPEPCKNPAELIEGYLELGGTVYIDGSFTLERTVHVRTGSQIVGATTAVLTLSGDDTNLFLIDAPVGTNELGRTSGIVFRDLTLNTTGTGNTAIAIVGEPGTLVGGASDLHFSGLTIEGFKNGFYVRPDAVDEDGNPAGPQPMVDGLSLKNSSFINNQTAFRSLSANASNWNIMNLNVVTSADNTAIGWFQKGGGHQSLQNVSCQGADGEQMAHCIWISMTGTYLTGLAPTTYVTNALTVGEGILTHLVVRDSDFRSSAMTQSTVNLLGRAFITSLNNKYNDFNVESPPGTNYLWRADYSRLTYCGDTYGGGIYTGVNNGLAIRHPNLIVGGSTLTRVACGPRPIPWDDATRWGGELGDKPLAGNFYDNARDDFVVYRDGTTNDPHSYFLIKQAGGTGTTTIQWGLEDDRPMIGRFFPNSRAQIVIWRPSDGYFWAYDPRLFAPNTATWYAWHWGQAGDVPFVGNFIDEFGVGGENYDEVAVYRHNQNENAIYILNPRSGEMVTLTTDAAVGSEVQVGDFLGLHYDQIALYKEGTWRIVDPNTGTQYTAYLGAGDDVPVAGKYLSGTCTQLGVWKRNVQPLGGEPDHSEFLVADSQLVNCGTRTATMIWGSNNELGATGQYQDDIPLTISTLDGLSRRPTVFRPTTGAFPFSISNGQWWVHDPF